MARTTDHTHHLRVRETQMEMQPDLPRGASPLGEDFEGKLETAQRQLEQLQHQREELERQKRELEEINARKKTFIHSQAEITERLSTAVTLIERELLELGQETLDLEQTRQCFGEHLSRLGKMDPEGWSRGNMAANLEKALAAIDHAEDEYEQAVHHFDGMRSGRIFGRGGPGKRAPHAATGTGFLANLRNGVAFNLPLLVLGSVALVIWWFK